MSTIKFIDALPEAKRGGRPSAISVALAQLRSQPGQWAEIARYPKHKRENAQSRGFQTVRRHPDIEYAVRTVGDESVLFLRAVAQ